MPATRLGRRIPALEPTSPVASRPGVSHVGKTPRPPGAFPVKSLSAMPLPMLSPLAVPIGTAIRRACRAPASDCSSRHRPVALPPTVRQAADRLRRPLPVSGATPPPKEALQRPKPVTLAPPARTGCAPAALHRRGARHRPRTVIGPRGNHAPARRHRLEKREVAGEETTASRLDHRTRCGDRC